MKVGDQIWTFESTWTEINQVSNYRAKTVFKPILFFIFWCFTFNSFIVTFAKVHVIYLNLMHLYGCILSLLSLVTSCFSGNCWTIDVVSVLLWNNSRVLRLSNFFLSQLRQSRKKHLWHKKIQNLNKIFIK